MGNFVQDCEREWILEAINHLKHRKARPDLSRISLRMKRKHQIHFAQTKKLLESLIESGIVVKAVYKNNTSYRDVSKWKKGRLGGHIQNSNKMLKRFVRAIEAKEISKGTGVTCEEIEDFLKSHGEEKCFLSGAALVGALDKEVSTGFLKKMYVGTVLRYFVNEDKEHLVQILKQTDDEDLDLDLDLDLEPDEETQSTSKIVKTDFKGLKEKVIEAVRETGHLLGHLGSSASSIKHYLFEKHCLKHEDVSVDKLLEHFVTNNVLKKSGEFYSISDVLPSDTTITVSTATVPCEIQKNDSNSQITVASTISPVPSSNSKDDALDEEEAQQVKILQLQGLSLVPKSSSQKATSSKLSSLHFLFGTNLSNGEAANIKDATNLGPSRPPSKRKRIIKDHGPDFEMEMPTKAKGKSQETKDQVYPTPSNSPASEQSECTLTESLKNSLLKKKRGRPKKIKEEPLENCSRPATPSESLHIFTGSNNQDEDSCSSTSLYQDISAWTSQQVADYFKERGFVAEAHNMLEHDIDGSALGLLKRSDIVGPPLGGILQIKKLGTALKLFRDIRDLLYQGHSSNYVDPYEERPFLRF